jgi:hypothetical protein
MPYPKTIRALPVFDVGASNAKELQIVARLDSNAHQLLELHERQKNAKTSHERTALVRQIEATDREIDALVYELYGLTDAEIRLVEDATAR